MHDHDFHASRDDADHAVEILSEKFRVYEVSEDALGITVIGDRKTVISITYPDSVTEAISRCSDLIGARHLGVGCMVISERTQLAIKLGYINSCRHHKDKNLKDIAFWSSRVSMGHEHVNVMEAMKRKSRYLFRGKRT